MFLYASNLGKKMETLTEKTATVTTNGVSLDNAEYPILPEVRNWITSHTPIKEDDLAALPLYKPTKEELELIFTNREDPRIVALVRRMSPEQLEYFKEFKAVPAHDAEYHAHRRNWEGDEKYFLGRQRGHPINWLETLDYAVSHPRSHLESHAYFVLANMNQVVKRDKKKTTQLITPELVKRRNALRHYQTYNLPRAA